MPGSAGTAGASDGATAVPVGLLADCAGAGAASEGTINCATNPASGPSSAMREAPRKKEAPCRHKRGAGYPGLPPVTPVATGV